MNWTYAALMTTAVATAVIVFRLTQQPLGLTWREKLAVGWGAFVGGMIGAKLPFVLADWQGFLDGTAWLDDGKTIVSGLVGGYLGVELVEWLLGIRSRDCDRFAVPLAAAIAVGRLACFHAGCCYGTATSLPWGVDFGDGVCRHPTQLYEAAFHLTAAVVLYGLQRRHLFAGQLVKLYFVAYFFYRFATEFIRPEPALWLGLTGYQWAALVLVPFFAFWSCPGCRPQAARRLWSRGPTPPASWKESHPGSIQFLKTTDTLCPECLERVPGHVFADEGKVYMERECPKHGSAVALISSDRRHYYLRDEVSHAPLGKKCCCGSGPAHRTCIALLELTEACNLACPVCFARSPRAGHGRFEDLCADLEAFLAARGPLDVLQLSGGEPLLHPELLRILDHCQTLPIDHVMINTNGLALLTDPSLAGELARRTPHLELSLQFDGLDRQSHVALRGADLLERKRAVLAKILEYKLPTTLVCTVVRGVSEHELGPLLRLALEHPTLRGITLQPATWSGRFAVQTDPLDRLTLADVVRLLVEQSKGLLREDDFQPLPCSNPNCCSFTFIARPPGKRPFALTRMVHFEDHADRLADRVNFKLSDARAVGGDGQRPEHFLRIMIKPFMDAYTYDFERSEECCVHVIRPGGKAVSFCRFNTLERGRTNGFSASNLVQIGEVNRV